MSPTLTATKSVPAAEAAEMIGTGTAPDNLCVEGNLELSGPEVVRLPRGLTVRRLRLTDCPNLEALPPGLRVRHLEMADVPGVTALPRGLHCYEIRARASALTHLPNDLHVEFRLDLQDGRALTSLSAGLKTGTLILSNCTALTALPAGLDVCFLDLQGCAGLRIAGQPDCPRRACQSCRLYRAGETAGAGPGGADSTCATAPG